MARRVGVAARCGRRCELRRAGRRRRAARAGSRTPKPSITAGGDHSCVVLTAGTVKCWGRNLFGQLGNGTFSNSSTPVAVSGLSAVVAIAAGGAHTCAVVDNGTVKCWGRNLYGGVGQRHHDRLVDTGRGERSQRRGCDRGGRRSFVRCWRTGPPSAGATTSTASWATAPRPTRRYRSP